MEEQRIKIGTPASGQHHPAKPMLSIDEQINHLKSKGVTFRLCSEEEAAAYLTDRTYFFKIAAYRVLFQKRVGGTRDGQYIDLDFGYLKSLASLDRNLRYALLPLTLDVEHAARTKLMRIATAQEDEDGYSISADYVAQLSASERHRREREIAMLSRNTFVGDLVRKYGDLNEMPLWVLMEVLSFGSFASLYLYCADRWGDKDLKVEHYMLRQAQYVRNACAHSSDMLNGLRTHDNRFQATPSLQNALASTGLSHRVRTARMSNPCLKAIATLLYLHSQMVQEGTSRLRAISDMQHLEDDMVTASNQMLSNDTIRSSLDFLMVLIDSWFSLGIIVSDNKTFGFYKAGLRKRSCLLFFISRQTIMC